MLNPSIRVFKGLNRRDEAETGEFEEAINLTASRYPCAAPREGRGESRTAPGKIYAAAAPISSDGEEITEFTGVADGAFYYNGVKKSGSVTLDTDYSWEIARLGNLYIINGCLGTVSVMYRYNAVTDDFARAGTEMTDLIVTAGVDDTGSYLATIKYGYDEVEHYSATDDNGNTIDNMDFFDKYAENGALPASNIFADYFEIGDEVTISGFPSKAENFGQVWSYQNGTVLAQKKNYKYNNTVDAETYSDISEVDKWALCSAVVKAFKEKEYTVSGVTTYAHYIYFDLADKNGDAAEFVEMAGEVPYYCSGVVLATKMRAFNHICVHHNRIWGTNPLGTVIYASASDNVFSFSAADVNAEYAARLPSDTPGSFTALCPWGGDLLAFKPDSISVISGTNPQNYYVYNIVGRGAIDGRSVAALPEGVIFLSRGGFSVYAGNTPKLIDEKLDTRYVSAAAGYDGVRYYAAAEREDGEKETVVYDTLRGLWQTEDCGDTQNFFFGEGKLYMVGETDFRRVSGGSETVEWSAVLARTTADTLDYKAISELWLRVRADEGAYITVETAINDGDFVKHIKFAESGTHIFRCPVRAKNAEDFRVRLSGEGRVVIHEIEARLTEGGRKHIYGGSI